MSDGQPPLPELGDYVEFTFVSKSIEVVSRLGVADAVAGGVTDLEVLSAEVGADAGALRRVLRLLSAHGFFQLDGDVVSLTDRSQLMLGGGPLGRDMLFCGTLAGISALEHAVRTGTPGFDVVKGESFWDHLSHHPDERAAFDRVQRLQATILGMVVGPKLSLPDARSIVDVGGGDGTLLAAVLTANPAADGVVFDISAPREPVSHDRMQFATGDMFTGVPRADAYLMGRVLHNWADDDVTHLLSAVHECAPPEATLCVIEMPLDESPGRHPSKALDIGMLLLFGGGRQRTHAELVRLLESVGWKVDEVDGDIGAGMTVLRAVA